MNNECIQVFYYDHDGRTRILDGSITIDRAIYVLKLFKHQWQERLEVQGNEINMYSAEDPNRIVNTYNCWNPETVAVVLEGIDALERARIKQLMDCIPPQDLAEVNIFNLFRLLRSILPLTTFKQFLQVWMGGEE